VYASSVQSIIPCTSRAGTSSARSSTAAGCGRTPLDRQAHVELPAHRLGRRDHRRESRDLRRRLLRMVVMVDRVGDELRQRPSADEEARDRAMVDAEVLLLDRTDRRVVIGARVEQFRELVGEVLIHDEQADVVQQAHEVRVLGTDLARVTHRGPEPARERGDRHRVRPELLMVESRASVPEGLHHGEHRADRAHLVEAHARDRAADRREWAPRRAPNAPELESRRSRVVSAGSVR
jgi:hypothetical protein